MAGMDPKTNMNDRPRSYGRVMMLLAALCFSGGGAAIKYVPWNSFAINGSRNLIAAMVIGIFILVTRHKIKINITVIIGAVSLFGVTTLFTVANKITTAANAIIIQYTAPIWVIVIMLVLFGKKPTRLQLAAIFVVLAGIICFFIDSLSAGGMAGNLAALASGVCYAVVFMMNSFEKGDAISSVFIGQLLSAVIQTPFIITVKDFSPTAIGGILFLGIIQVGVGYIFFNEGTKYTDPVSSCLIAALEPILNPVWVALIFGEMITPVSLAGGVIVIFAVVGYNILSSREERKEKVKS